MSKHSYDRRRFAYGGRLFKPYYYYVTFRVPSVKIFHETDSEFSDFEDAANAVMKKAGGELVSSARRQNNWEIVWELPKEPLSCCADPHIRGGQCENCGIRDDDVDFWEEKNRASQKKEEKRIQDIVSKIERLPEYRIIRQYGGHFDIE